MQRLRLVRLVPLVVMCSDNARDIIRLTTKLTKNTKREMGT